MRISIALACVLTCQIGILADIPQPADTPKPRSPEESAKLVSLPDGYELRLLSSEPLVKEPSGICWDEAGHCFVSELHGYNLEGQFDIEELNKTGELDRLVRRVQANDRAKKQAEQEVHGVVKRLLDENQDGRMDKAQVWADDLPPCLGICPANGGIIAVCSPKIVFLADRDQDGKAEVRETLFEGFATGVIERRINSPQWGPDNWIYIGRGQGGRITGPHLKTPVDLPASDFRIKPDGSRIEPVTGGTQTFGFTFDESGNRFVVSTASPAILVAPLPWEALARNPHLAPPALERNIAPYQTTFPVSKPHPWRTRRADDPGFSKYYTDRYGQAESAPNGYFTSACSPLIYQDSVLPGLKGHLLACEPAQNLVHRGILEGPEPKPILRRAPGEEASEFLASADVWFHPIALAHAPDGTIAIVDFYREIIEDYSAIPRYLQQQYGLIQGRDHGRIWILTHRDASPSPVTSLRELSAEELAKNVNSPLSWRRQTARRLLIERQHKTIAPMLKAQIQNDDHPASVMNALYTLAGLESLDLTDIRLALKSRHAAVRVHALRLSEPWIDENASLLDDVLALAGDAHDSVLLQLALTLGEAQNAKVLPVLAQLARKHGDDSWMATAVLSSLTARGVAFLKHLLPKQNLPTQVDHSGPVLAALCQIIGSRRDPTELSLLLILLSKADDSSRLEACLVGFAKAFSDPVLVGLSDKAGVALRSLEQREEQSVRQAARKLTVLMKAETAAQRTLRLEQAKLTMSDIGRSGPDRLKAVEELAAENDGESTEHLMKAFGESTPKVRATILSAFLSRKDRHADLLSALEKGRMDVAALTAIQRETLVNANDKALAARARRLFSESEKVPPEVLTQYTLAFKAERDLDNGQRVFRAKCASCHQTHGLGHAVGPDLAAEFQRAEETILLDLLTPSATISPEYTSYTVQTTAGRTYSGLLAMETHGSLTLKEAEGKTQTILRIDIEALRVSQVSMMPDNLTKDLSPRDVADVIAWIRRPPASFTLFDENPGFVELLDEGEGTASIVTEEAHSGDMALKITPLQRFSARIPGWSFRIRENPKPGEFRYLTWAWKTPQGEGALVEIATEGRWPPADSPRFRYYSGRNTSDWQATLVSQTVPRDWTMVTRDLWKDFGDTTITGLAPTALQGAVLFDRIQLSRNKP